MSYGMCICSVCRREVHQARDRSWYHCDFGEWKGRGGPMCEGAEAVFPKLTEDGQPMANGDYCGIDDF